MQEPLHSLPKSGNFSLERQMISVKLYCFSHWIKNLVLSRFFKVVRVPFRKASSLYRLAKHLDQVDFTFRLFCSLLEPYRGFFVPLFRLLRWRIFVHISILDSKTKPSLVGMNIWRCTQVVEGSALENEWPFWKLTAEKSWFYGAFQLSLKSKYPLVLSISSLLFPRCFWGLMWR